MLATSIHVLGGLIALASGAIAMGARKGAPLHRRSGQIFVYSMLCMAVTGTVLAAFKPDRGSVIAGMLAFYLVCTSFMTVRTTVAASRKWFVLLMLIGLSVGAAGVSLGLHAMGQPGRLLDGNPALVFVFFGGVALIAAVLDARALWVGGLVGAHRLARHLWRMGFAMFLATASFFLGQAKVFPASLRSPEFLAVPVVLVIVVTMFWLVRVLWRHREA